MMQLSPHDFSETKRFPPKVRNGGVWLDDLVKQKSDCETLCLLKLILHRYVSTGVSVQDAVSFLSDTDILVKLSGVKVGSCLQGLCHGSKRAWSNMSSKADLV